MGVNAFCKQGGKQEGISHKSRDVVASCPSADLDEGAGCKALGEEWAGGGQSYDIWVSGVRWAVNQSGL